MPLFFFPTPEKEMNQGDITVQVGQWGPGEAILGWRNEQVEGDCFENCLEIAQATMS